MKLNIEALVELGRHEMARAGAWDANLFVIAITFSVQRGNIDHV